MDYSQYSHEPVKPKANKFAKGCGCIVILGIIGVIAMVLIGIFSSDDKPEDKRADMLREDLQKVTSNPPASDSLAFYLKMCVGISITGIETDEIKYYTKANGNKLLVLLKVGDMKGVEKSTRKILVEGVQDCLEIYELGELTEHYIGVQGNWNMLLVQTPKGSDLDGKFADKDLLLPFYDETNPTQNNLAPDSTK